ncbi:hypothetical protein I204_06378 [Kwoniella mangroviensis CBS 8886]|nr:hypothetical protein I204_06378 [Kwoniella mangroviensis CBS 8886]
MLRITSTFSFVGTLSLVSLVSAQSYSETYLGCFSVATGWAVAESSPTATSITECNAACADLGYPYAYYSHPSAYYCLCITQSPAAGCLRQAQSEYTDCGDSQTTVYALSTDYDFVKCYSSPSSDDTSSQSSIEACFTHCSTYNNALIGYGGNHFNCICLNESLDLEGEAQQCGQSGLYFAYIHTPASSASTVERRRRRLERMKRDEQLRLNRFCPSRLEACVVPGSEDSLECIDTSSELESCGGCLYGSYSNSTSSIGTDCSTLSGAAFGGSTCFDGRCQISACEEGFKIVDGRCQ